MQAQQLPQLRTRPRAMAAAALAVAVATAMAMPAPAAAQEDGIIDISGPSGAVYKLALQRFAAPGALKAEAAQVEAGLRAGLEFSNRFELIDEAAFLEPVQSPAPGGALMQAAAAPRCTNWSQIGADALAQGRVAPRAGTVLTPGVAPTFVRAELQLWDVARCTPLLRGNNYSGPAKAARRLGLRMADDIVKAYLGQRGVADTEIVFVSSRRSSVGDRSSIRERVPREIWIMDATGSRQRAATRHRSLSTFPSFSPQGEAFLYTSYRHRGRPRLFVAARSALRGAASWLHPGRILENLEGHLYRGVFSPDGARLAVVLSKQGSSASDIYIARAGAPPRNLTARGSIDVAPTWSPDGKRIAFVSDRAGAPQIYVMDAAPGAKPKRLTFNGAYNAAPAWSPDGRWIAYQTRVRGQFDIWMVSPGGGRARPLITNPRTDEHPSWSPDSGKLAFSSKRRGRSEIYVYDVTTRAVRRLTRAGINTAPSWGPYRQ